MTDRAQNIATMKAWIKRRKNLGHVCTADEIQERIDRNWPNLESAEREAIFQGSI